MREISKNKSGITLIALVITIIILLILAGVSIAMLTGDNGLLKKVEIAKQENEEAKELELIKLAVSSAQAAGEGTLTTENLSNELKTNLNDNNVKEISDGWWYKKYLIYKDGNIEKRIEGILPSIYQQVEYIESTGTQYIDTEYIPKVNTELLLEVSFSGTFKGAQNHNTAIFSTRNKDNSYDFSLNFGGNSNEGNTLYAWVNKSYENGGTKCFFNINDNIRTNRNLIKMKSGSITYETISRDLDEKTEDNDNSLVLFAWRYTYVVPMSAYNMKVYSLKLYEGETLKRNFVPCYSKQNEKIGLYDTVEGKFYTNQGTGEFIKGENV